MDFKSTLAIICYLLSSFLLHGQENFRLYIGEPDPWTDEYVSAMASLGTSLVAVGYSDRSVLRETQLALYFVDKGNGAVTDSVFLPTESTFPIQQVIANENGEFAVLRAKADNSWEFLFFSGNGENTGVLNVDLNGTSQEIISATFVNDGSVIYLLGPCVRSCAGPSALVRQRANGEIQWRQDIFGSTVNQYYSLTTISPTEVVVFGAKRDTAVIAKYGLSGNLLWDIRPTEIIGGGQTRRLGQIYAVTPFGEEGNIMITGKSLFDGQFYQLLDAQGNLVNAYENYLSLNSEEENQFTAVGDTLVFTQGSGFDAEYRVMLVRNDIVSLDRSVVPITYSGGKHLLDGTSVYSFGRDFLPYDFNVAITRYQVTPSRELDWYTSYGDQGYNHFEEAAKTLIFSDESFLVSANTSENGTNFQQVLLHFTPQGVENWRASLTVSETPNLNLLSLIEAQNGDILTSHIINESYMQVARLSPSGEIRWQFSGEQSNTVSFIKDENLMEFSDGRIGYLSTSIERDNFNELKLTILSAEGVQLEERYFPDLSTFNDYAAYPLSDGKAVFTGISTSDQSLTLFLYDPISNTTQWLQKLNDQTGVRGTVLECLQHPETETIYVLSRENDPVDGGLKLWLTSLTPMGIIIDREQILERTYAFRGSTMHLTNQGEIQLSYPANELLTPGPDEFIQSTVEWRALNNLALLYQGTIRNPTGFFALEDSAPIGLDATLFVGLAEASPQGRPDIFILRTDAESITNITDPGSVASDIKAIPNPTSGSVTVSFQSSESTKISWRLLSSRGEELLSGTTLPGRSHVIPFDLSELSLGVYFFLGLDEDMKRYSQKVMRQ